jgi:hypothetical protein
VNPDIPPPPQIFYILDANGNPVAERDIDAWALWVQNANRTLARDVVGDVTISTVFLGYDHNHGFSGKPILWETMIFGGLHDQYQDRYSTREGALTGHHKAVFLASTGEAAVAMASWTVRSHDGNGN